MKNSFINVSGGFHIIMKIPGKISCFYIYQSTGLLARGGGGVYIKPSVETLHVHSCTLIVNLNIMTFTPVLHPHIKTKLGVNAILHFNL